MCACWYVGAIPIQTVSFCHWLLEGKIIVRLSPPAVIVLYLLGKAGLKNMGHNHFILLKVPVADD